MSLIFLENNNLRRLKQLYRYQYLDMYFSEIADERNVIEVGHWVKEITDAN